MPQEQKENKQIVDQSSQFTDGENQKTVNRIRHLRTNLSGGFWE